MTQRGLALVLIAVWSTSVFAQGGATPAEPKRPAYDDRRFDENWSVLRGDGPGGAGDAWDRLKFIPLTDGQDWWLTLGGQVRGRQENVRQFQFGQSQPARSDSYGLSRIRFSADLHAGRHVRVFAEAKSSLATSRELSGGDSASFVDAVDLQNAFVDIVAPAGGTSTLTIRGGRQELLFGAQRLVGPSDWSNVRRTFQGVSAILQTKQWSVTPFWTELVVVRTHGLDEASPGNTLYGVHASKDGRSGATPELYWLAADNAAAAFNGTSGRERRQTIGGRLSRGSAAGRFDFDAEAAAQFGTIGAASIRASMLSVNGGYSHASRLKPRVFATVDFASGDGRTGGRVGTFNQLYPNNHTYLGTTDYIGRQNILSPSAGLSVQPAANLTLSATHFHFWRASVHDGLYNSSGTVLRPGDGTTARYVGAETDLVATYHFDRHLLGYASYNHFFPGDFIHRTGPARHSDYVYGALQFTF